MTIFVGDIASYQNGLTPTALLAAGFTGVNVKISHGLTRKAVHPDADGWLSDTRFTRSTFHYLTGEASGQEQAGYAYARLRELVPSGPVAHVVDVEDTGITTAVYGDYVSTMAGLLGRPIVTYTGAWFATSRPWIVRSVNAPWRWEAPATGYLSSYPGDTDLRWAALDVMQYAVLPIGGIKVSMSAVRDPQAWDAMRGIDMAWQTTKNVKNLQRQFNVRFPNRDRTSDGTIGDAAHQTETSGHNPDDTPGGKPAWDGDPDNTPEVRAWDCDSDLGEPGTTAQMIVDHMRRLPNLGLVIRYMIYNRKMYHERDGYAPTPYTGSSPHMEHIHFEGAWSQAADENDTFDFQLERVGNMPLTADEKKAIIDGVVAAVPKAVWGFDPGTDNTGGIWPGVSDATFPPGGNGTVAPGTALSSLLARQKGYGDSDRAAAAQLLSAVQSASGVPADVLAAALAPLLLLPILAAVNALPAGEHLTKADVGEALANVLRLGVGQGGS